MSEALILGTKHPAVKLSIVDSQVTSARGVWQLPGKRKRSLRYPEPQQLAIFVG